MEHREFKKLEIKKECDQSTSLFHNLQKTSAYYETLFKGSHLYFVRSRYAKTHNKTGQVVFGVTLISLQNLLIIFQFSLQF